MSPANNDELTLGEQSEKIVKQIKGKAWEFCLDNDLIDGKSLRLIETAMMIGYTMATAGSLLSLTNPKTLVKYNPQ